MTDETERLDDPDLADTYVHFGPGVPLPPATAPDRATALWRGQISPAPAVEDPVLARRRRTQQWMLPLTVLILVIVVLIYYFWGRHSTDTSSLVVTGATVEISDTPIGCGGTERLTAIIGTNGHAGTINYQWKRNDGTTSNPLSQAVVQGEQQVSVVLEWRFDGYGVLDATATLHILSPGTSSASTSFMYRCMQ